MNDEEEERNWEKLKEIQAKVKVLMQLKDEPRFDLMKYGRRFVKLGNFVEVTGKRHDKVSLSYDIGLDEGLPLRVRVTGEGHGEP